ncbi:MAG: methionine--tRNA ligase [Treponema sp.]|jgi:methionyl-tRNA synthetase|nr:methionine--tRNA ligase [Treponema sp.]
MSKSIKRRLVTSALPYVNNVPHLGNLIQVLSADAFARFCRLRGYQTLYICGTDEYGTATENRAAEEGVSPRELCDRYHTIHADIYRWFNIAFDKFGRTSTPIQTEIVQDIFQRLDAKGLILERTIEQLYCPKCERFLADRYVRGTCPHCGSPDARGDQCEACGKLLDPTDLKESRCARCGSSPRLESTKHLYIDLPRIKDRLQEWIKITSVNGFWAHNAIQMTQAWIRDGLRERAITRDLRWGIPVPKPGYENKVFYVWFDAPIGYISITGNLGEETTADWRAFVDSWWKKPDEVELFQFIGKDNIPFHTVIFPSSLLGASDGAPSWTMLHHMSSSEYLNYESGKFSKSKGVGVFGTDVMETGIAADIWRFYIFYNRPEKADALFTWKDFQEKVNGELIGNLGNLVNRTLSFVTRYYDGTIPDSTIPNGTIPDDAAFRQKVEAYEAAITDKLERAELRDAFRDIFELSSFANKTFQDGEPWRTRKDDPPAAAALIHKLCHLVRDIAVLIHPFLPTAAEKIASFFGASFSGGASFNNGGLSWASLGQPGLSSVARTEVLFTRLEDELIDTLRERYAGTQQDRADKNQEQQEQTIQEQTLEGHLRFSNTLDLRVAQIVKIERHPKADKLYIETLELSPDASETRVIVSGIVPFYKEEELLGKRIIVAYNLKPAKLRGVESRGMLLAASVKDAEGRETVEVLDAGDTPLGTRVCLNGAEPGNPPVEIDIDTFFTVPLEVQDNTVLAFGRALTLEGKPIRTRLIATGGVH